MESQPNFPFEFVQGGAVEFLKQHGHEFDAIHASPPCQKWSRKTKHTGDPSKHPDLLTPILGLLRGRHGCWAVENVVGAPMRPTVVLCGSSFDLGVRRHRLFETNFFVPSLSCRHKQQGQPIGVYGNPDINTFKRKQGGRKYRSLQEGMDAMGIDWMTHTKEIREAIPPAYTRYVGHYMIEWIKEGR